VGGCKCHDAGNAAFGDWGEWELAVGCPASGIRLDRTSIHLPTSDLFSIGRYIKFRK
jgi:hypothetical protein